MEMCSPVEMRKNLVIVETFKRCGVDFVAVPVRSEDHKNELIKQSSDTFEFWLNESKLWAVHIEGPDSILACGSKEDAECHTDEFNKIVVDGVVAKVIQWEGDEESHAENLKNVDWSDPC